MNSWPRRRGVSGLGSIPITWTLGTASDFVILNGLELVVPGHL